MCPSSACTLTSRCCVIYLHVITYNEAAINMYLRNQYQCLGLLKVRNRPAGVKYSGLAAPGHSCFLEL